VRGQYGGAGVHRVGVEALLSQQLVEGRAHSGRPRAARQSPLTELSQAPHGDTAAQREPHLAVHEVNEGEALVRERGRNVVSVAARREHLAAFEQRQALPAIGLDVAEQGAPAGELREQELDREVAVGGDERRRHRIGAGHGQVTLGVSRRRDPGGRRSRPLQDLRGEEPPLATHAVPGETAAQEAIHVLRMYAQEPRDVAGGEQGAAALHVAVSERGASALHRPGPCLAALIATAGRRTPP
jgi:hypothetical protein